MRVRRLSGRPSAFLLRNMLDPSDCERIAEAARAAGMERADTVCGNAWSRRRCDVAWLATELVPMGSTIAVPAVRLRLNDAAVRLNCAPAPASPLPMDLGADAVVRQRFRAADV